MNTVIKTKTKVVPRNILTGNKKKTQSQIASVVGHVEASGPCYVSVNSFSLQAIVLAVFITVERCRRSAHGRKVTVKALPDETTSLLRDEHNTTHSSYSE